MYATMLWGWLTNIHTCCTEICRKLNGICYKNYLFQFRFRNNLSSACLSWQIFFLSTFRHVTLILITSNKKQHKLLLIRKWLHWNNAVNKDVFFPLFIVCCVCTVGGVNLKVAAVYFPSQWFENELQCRKIICRLELRHARSFPRPPLRPTIFFRVNMLIIQSASILFTIVCTDMASHWPHAPTHHRQRMWVVPIWRPPVWDPFHPLSCPPPIHSPLPSWSCQEVFGPKNFRSPKIFGPLQKYLVPL